MTTTQAVRARYIAVWDGSLAVVTHDPVWGLTAQLPGIEDTYLVSRDEIAPLPDPHSCTDECTHAIVLPLGKTQGVEICYYCREKRPAGTCPRVCPRALALRETSGE